MRKFLRKPGLLARNHLKWLYFFGAGNGIRTRDFNLGKVALYH